VIGRLVQLYHLQLAVSGNGCVSIGLLPVPPLDFGDRRARFRGDGPLESLHPLDQNIVGMASNIYANRYPAPKARRLENYRLACRGTVSNYKQITQSLGARRRTSSDRGAVNERLCIDDLVRRWVKLVKQGNGNAHCEDCGGVMELDENKDGPKYATCDRIDASDDRNPYKFPDGRLNFRFLHWRCNKAKGPQDNVSKLTRLARIISEEIADITRVMGDRTSECVSLETLEADEIDVEKMEKSYEAVVVPFQNELKEARVDDDKRCETCFNLKRLVDFPWTRQHQEGQTILRWYVKEDCLECIHTKEQKSNLLEFVRDLLQRSKCTRVEPEAGLELFKQQNEKCAICGEPMQLQLGSDSRRTVLEIALTNEKGISTGVNDYVRFIRNRAVKGKIEIPSIAGASGSSASVNGTPEQCKAAESKKEPPGKWIHAYCHQENPWAEVALRMKDVQTLRWTLRERVKELEDEWVRLNKKDGSDNSTADAKTAGDIRKRQVWSFLLRKRREKCLRCMKNARDQMLELFPHREVCSRTLSWNTWLEPCVSNARFVAKELKMALKHRANVTARTEKRLKKRKPKSVQKPYKKRYSHVDQYNHEPTKKMQG
jgi:hypothetical protein